MILMVTPKKKPSLLSCPFCPSTDIHHYADGEEGKWVSWVECGKCEAVGPIIRRETKTQAFLAARATWNRTLKKRVAVPDADDLQDLLIASKEDDSSLAAKLEGGDSDA